MLSFEKNLHSEVGLKCLVNLALDQKVSWTMLKGFLFELTSTLEASKKLNAILVDELQLLHSKMIENKSQAIHEKAIVGQNESETREIVENDTEDDVILMFSKQETFNDEINTTTKTDVNIEERIHDTSDNESISIEDNSSDYLEAPYEESLEIEMKVRVQLWRRIE